MDDAAFVLMDEKSPWMKWLCQLRHLNTTVFMCIQVWKSISPCLKTQITNIQLVPGYSRQQVNYIYNQICVDMKFDDFYELYVKVPQKQDCFANDARSSSSTSSRRKLIIDLVDMTVKVD